LQCYYAEMRSLLRDLLGADQVLVFDHTVRSGGDRTGAAQGADGDAEPVNRVHCDYTESSAQVQLERLGEQGVFSRARGRLLSSDEFQQLAQHRFMLVNVWRSIAAPGVPVERWPLAVCDASTVPSADHLYYEVIHPIYTDHEGENLALRSNAAHRWYYFPKMTRDECLVFKTYDSRNDEAQFAFHSAFEDPHTDPDAPARQSIEVRALALFGTGLPEDEVLQRKVRVKGRRIVGKESPHE